MRKETYHIPPCTVPSLPLLKKNAKQWQTVEEEEEEEEKEEEEENESTLKPPALVPAPEQPKCLTNRGTLLQGWILHSKDQSKNVATRPSAFGTAGT